MNYYIFIDPASKSTGWALFKASGELQASGTIAVAGRDAHLRLVTIWVNYTELELPNPQTTEVHIEQLRYGVSHLVTESVGVIQTALALRGFQIGERVHIKAWQKVAQWNREWKKVSDVTGRLEEYAGEVESMDELAAIGMGLYWMEVKV